MFKFLFFSVIALLPLGRIVSLSFLQSERKTAPLSPLEVVLPLLIGAYILRMLIKKRLPFRKGRQANVILGFALWALISLFLNGQYYHLSQGEVLFSSLYLARWVVYAALYFISMEYASSRSR